MEHKQTILLAPSLSNSSCWRGGTSEAAWTGPGPGELIRATLILLLSLGILCANLLVICVINSRRYSKYIHAQPRYLLTSLASNDLAIGLLVTPFGFLPAVYGCWPYGEVVCQIQALLRGALTQQSAVILVCMAIDRYVCMLHPHRYHKHSSKRSLKMEPTKTSYERMLGTLKLRPVDYHGSSYNPVIVHHLPNDNKGDSIGYFKGNFCSMATAKLLIETYPRLGICNIHSEIFDKNGMQ
ncbi:Neuropeptide FF receptor 2 [Camponotus floridanus]|uniref:Neuropeptide FF receptor 2 n=1 Tax=Camponotus floridanus TaxID=104421 RepID=E2AB52_CAMFO|nr:Neuropeptide FF receptor 2 [Camponotus floridanus]